MNLEWFEMVRIILGLSLTLVGLIGAILKLKWEKPKRCAIAWGSPLINVPQFCDEVEIIIETRKLTAEHWNLKFSEQVLLRRLNMTQTGGSSGRDHRIRGFVPKSSQISELQKEIDNYVKMTVPKRFKLFCQVRIFIRKI